MPLKSEFIFLLYGLEYQFAPNYLTLYVLSFLSVGMGMTIIDAFFNLDPNKFRVIQLNNALVLAYMLANDTFDKLLDDFDFGYRDFSLSGWFYLDELPSVGGNNKGIIGKFGSVPYYYVSVFSTDLLYVVTNLGSGNISSISNATVSTNRW